MRASSYRNSAQLRIQNPNLGHRGTEHFGSLVDKGWRMVRSEAQAEAIWRAWFDHTESSCAHGDACTG